MNILDLSKLDELIDSVKCMKKQIEDLKREKSQLESLCAAIVKNSNQDIKITFIDLIKSDFKKVRIAQDEDNLENVGTVQYLEDYESEAVE